MASSVAERRMVNMLQPADRLNVLNRGLVGWWKALPGLASGSRYVDIVTPNQHGFHGTLTNGPLWGAALRQGEHGSLAFVSASSQHVTTNAAFAGAGVPFSFAATFYVPTVDGTSRSILGSTGGSGPALRVASLLDFIQQGVSAIAQATVVAGGTYRVLVTWDGTSAYAMYLNGTQVTTGTSVRTLTAGSLYIGRTAAGQYWTGNIDNVCLWNYVLPRQLAELETAPIGRLTSQRLNYLSGFNALEAAGGGGATAVPVFYYHNQMQGMA